MTRLDRRALLAGCIVTGATLLVSPANGDDDLSFHPDAIAPQSIDSFLQTKQYKSATSPMVGTGSYFVQEGQTFNIDPALVVAMSGIETDFGLRTCTTDNAWNWFWQGPCPASPFTSYDDAIQTVSKYLRLSYINKGYNTIPLIQKKYCTAPVQNGVTCPGWISTVTQFRDQMAGLAPSPPVTGQPSQPNSSTGGPTTTPTSSASGIGKLWWFAGAGVVLALGLGWLIGRRKRTSQ
ncbi:MAG TPA: hypothetical protein VLY24_12545 [Bryobacteraceae bacterium]|nr:hypothetical protein [Bryobacteraceae bacterium]